MPSRRHSDYDTHSIEFPSAVVESYRTVIARVCGHTTFFEFEYRGLATWKSEIADLTSVEYTGVGRSDRQSI